VPALQPTDFGSRNGRLLCCPPDAPFAHLFHSQSLLTSTETEYKASPHTPCLQPCVPSPAGSLQIFNFLSATAPQHSQDDTFSLEAFNLRRFLLHSAEPGQEITRQALGKEGRPLAPRTRSPSSHCLLSLLPVAEDSTFLCRAVRVCLSLLYPYYLPPD